MNLHNLKNVMENACHYKRTLYSIKRIVEYGEEMPNSGDLKSGHSLFWILPLPHPNINDQTPLPPINTNQPSLQFYQGVVYDIIMKSYILSSAVNLVSTKLKYLSWSK